MTSARLRGERSAIYGIKLLSGMLFALKSGPRTTREIYHDCSASTQDTVYKYLETLEGRGIIAGNMTDSDLLRGGNREIKHYQLTDKGREIIPALEKLQSVL